MHPIFIGAGSVSASDSTIETTISNSSGPIQVTESESHLDSGKVVVTATIMNTSNSDRNGGLIAIGKNTQGEAIETKEIHKENSWGDSTKLSANGSQTLSVSLDAGDRIQTVEVLPGGNSSSIELLSSGSRTENGKVIVTGVVENGSSTASVVGMMAEAKDSVGAGIEVGSDYSMDETWGKAELIDSNSAQSLSVSFDQSSSIEEIVVSQTGSQTTEKLLSYGMKKQDGKVIVTGVVENGTNAAKPLGLIVSGTDQNNQTVEVNSTYTQNTFGSVKSVEPHVPKTFSMTLNGGDAITKVLKPILIGQSSEVEVVSYGVRQKDGKVYVTGVVENGSSNSKVLKLQGVTYDKSDSVLEDKTSTSTDQFNRNVEVGSGLPYAFELVFNENQAKSVKVDIPEKLGSTSNQVSIKDLTAPKVTEKGASLEDKSKNVDVRKGISLTFNEEILEGSTFDEIIVKNQSGEPVEISKEIKGKTLTVSPVSSYEFESSYTFELPKKAIKDQMGNEQVEDYQLSFETATEGKPVDVYEIIHTTTNWNTNKSINNPIIIGPDATLTISSGVEISLANDLIVYGNLVNEGTINMNGHDIYANHVNWNGLTLQGDQNYLDKGVMNPAGDLTNVGSLEVTSPDYYPTIPMTIASPTNQSEVSQVAKIKGKTVSGFTVYMYGKSVKADENGAFELDANLQEGKANQTFIEITDNFERSHTVSSYSLTVSGADTVAPAAPEVDEVTDKSEQVSGTAEKGSTVIINKGTVELGRDKVDENGHFSLAISKQAVDTSLSIYAVDQAGNKSEATIRKVKDVTPPSAPTVNQLTDQSTEVTGNAEKGTSISIRKSSSEIGHGSVEESGDFTITIPKQSADTKFMVIAIDKAGNESESTTVVVKDGTAPARPSVKQVTDQSVEVNGSAEVEASISIKKDKEEIGAGTVNAEGLFSISIPKQSAGTFLTVTAMDKDGNVSEATEVEVKDATAPTKPVIDEITDQTTSIYGTTDPITKVVALKGKEELGSIVSGEVGYFYLPIPKQQAGTTLTFYAVDDSGIKSEKVTVTVVDKTAPSAPKVKEVTDQSTTVTGTAEKKSTVIIKVDKKEIGKGTVSETGEFTIAIEKQSANTKLSIFAIDEAGNESSATGIKVKDVTAPKAPVVDEVTDQSTKVNGKSEVGSTIFIKRGSEEVGKGSTDGDGKFNISISKQTADSILTVYAVDEAGNKSEETDVTVKDTTKPAKPEVKEVTDQSTEINGKAEAGSMISVLNGTEEIGQGLVLETGDFIISIPKQRANSKLNVTATDKAGNKSDTATIIVKDVTAPEAPKVDEVTNKTMAVTGKSEKNSIIKIKHGSNVIGQAEGNDGTFSVPITKQKAGTELMITSTDEAGNESQATKVVVVMVDDEAPVWPTNGTFTATVNDQAGKSVMLYWTQAEDEDIVKSYKIWSNDTLIATIDGDMVEYNVQQLKANSTYTFKIQAVDASGNVSKPLTTTVTTVKTYTAERISGDTRYDTAVSIASNGFEAADTVILAQGTGFADALAGAPLAFKMDAPILLTEVNHLTESTKSELKRLGAKKVIILGGEEAVSKRVSKTLDEMGLSVERIGGKDRFETSLLIAKKITNDPDKVIVANGMNFPDALSIAPYAAKKGYPIVLTKKDEMKSNVLTYAKQANESIFVGGEEVVNASIYKKFSRAIRLAGDDRFETSVEIAKAFNASIYRAYITTGFNFADALTGSVHAAKNDAPILLVKPEAIPEDTSKFIVDQDYNEFTILGGPNAVSESVEHKLIRK